MPMPLPKTRQSPDSRHRQTTRRFLMSAWPRSSSHSSPLLDRNALDALVLKRGPRSGASGHQIRTKGLRRLLTARVELFTTASPP